MAKNIWILEVYITPEHMQKGLAFARNVTDWARDFGNPAQVEAAETLQRLAEERIRQNPEGYWKGYFGKVNYRTFCDRAREILRDPVVKEDNMKFRVLEAERKNPNVTDWKNNYQNGVEDSEVLAYLYETL